MVKALIKIAKGHKLPGGRRPGANVMRQAAVDVLGQAHGRPEVRDPGVNNTGGTGLTIVVNQLFSGKQHVIQGENLPENVLDKARRVVTDVVANAREIQDATDR